MFEELAIDPSSFAGPSIVRDTERARERKGVLRGLRELRRKRDGTWKEGK